MPLTAKGSEIMGNMKSRYGEEKGERVFYASKNKGTIEGVDQMSGTATPTPTAGVSPSVTTAPSVTMPTPTTPPPVDAVGASSTVGGRTTGYSIETDAGGEGTARRQDPPNWAMDRQKPVITARDQARMAGAKDDWSPEAREAAAKARAAHSGGGGAAGPEGHQQLHQKLTASGSQHRETETHHVWTNPKAGTQTEVSKKSGPTNKEPEGAKPWYHKVEAEHGKSREGPGGSRITGSGFQQRQWQAPKAQPGISPREREQNIKRDLRPAHVVARAYGQK